MIRIIFHRIVRRLRNHGTARWLDTPSGCCECGTGGPYYRGTAAQVTRYVYSGACHGTPTGEVDWSSCSRHPLTGIAPIIDYGRDLVVTFRQTEADARERGGRS